MTQIEYVTQYWCPHGEVRLYRIDPHYVVMMYHPEEKRWKELLCFGIVHAIEMYDWCIETIVNEVC